MKNIAVDTKKFQNEEKKYFPFECECIHDRKIRISLEKYILILQVNFDLFWKFSYFNDLLRNFDTEKNKTENLILFTVCTGVD